ncbi:hypothetical protein B0H13DRAFT_1666076 [Mycena leptocephala]|nr:hypothetical protein B0H13DRAFT_1666076 [Mycena leptocephala]
MWLVGCLRLRSDISIKHEIEKILNSIKTILGNRIVPSAKYDAKEQREREYVPNTRVGVLQEIISWSNTRLNTEQCLWITGKVYVGKSTIAMHLAQKFGDENILYAQFFIATAIDSTTDPNSIFPTMAWHLAERSPLAAMVIKKNLDSVPSHASMLSKEQAFALFVQPLQVIAQYADKVVIIIDGVDELSELRESRPRTLYKATSVLCGTVHHLPSQVKVIVFSRPEQPIVVKIPAAIKRLELPIEKSISDTEQIFNAKLTALANTYGLEDWPRPEQIEQLCILAAGHLGWTQLVIAWITQQIEQSARKRVRAQELFEELQATSLVAGDLESLYQLILKQTTPTSTRNHEEFLKGFPIIIGALAVLQEPLDISTLARLVVFELESSGLKDLDLVDFLDEMNSIFLDGTHAMSKTTVAKAHTSFFEYLTSDRCDSSLKLSLPKHHACMTDACFRICQKELCFNIGRIKTSHLENEDPEIKKQPISPHIVYACKFLGRHLEQSKEQVKNGFYLDINNFMKTNFLHWLEVLSLTGEVASAVSTLQDMEKNIPKNDTLLPLIRDAIEFIKRFKIPIRISAPHIYISALPQAPTSSLIRQQYLPQFPRLLCMKEGPQSWDRCRNDICVFNSDSGPIECGPFIGHTDIVRCIDYSADSTTIVSCSKDQTVRSWNALDGTCKFTFQAHADWHAVSCSPKNTQIAAGPTWYDAIQLCTLGTNASRTLEHKGPIQSIAFSHDGQSLVAGSPSTICVWDLSAPQDSMKVVGYHLKKGTTSVGFFPDGKQIMSAAEDTIRVWDGSELAEVKCSPEGDGYWVHDNKKELLFWSLSGVRHRRNTLVIGPHIDLSHFVDGERWEECTQALPLS